MRTTFLCLVLLLMSLASLSAKSIESAGSVRVGIFPFEPINFVDDQGVAQGLYPDLIRRIVAEEDWAVEFVPGTWAQGLERLQQGEIDLMTTIAYTEERAQVMDFNKEPVVNIWGQVFLRPDEKINTITDLEGRRVAITERDISGANFIKTIDGFGVVCAILKYPRHEDVFKALRNGEVDAAVAPSHFGLRHAAEYGLVPSSIQFSPFSIYFATKKGHYPELLQYIDKHLAAWKAAKNSYYYERLNYWMGGKGFEREIIPLWLLTALGTFVLAALIFFFLSLAFRAQVRKTTSELLALEQEYRRLVQSIGSIVMRIDQQGVIRFINDYGLEFFGYAKDEMVGRNVMETVVPEQGVDGRPLRPLIKKILTRPEGFEIVENVNVCKDGRRVFIQWRNRPEYDESGRQVGVFSVGTDMTERQRDEEILRAKEEKFRTLFEHVTDYALVLQPRSDGLYIVDLSESACRFHGYAREELLGQPISFLDMEDVSTDDWRLQKVGEGEMVRFEVTHRRKDGSTFPVEAVVRMLEIDGEPLIFSIERDLTPRKQVEAERNEMERNLRQKFKMEAIGTLAGGIAHDFNNILAIILGSAELLKRVLAEDPKSLEKVERILNAGGRAKSLVEQVLTFSRQQEQSLKPVQVSELVTETVALLRATIPRTVEIRVNFTEESPSLRVLADPVQLQQVLINLCSNASFAMQEQGIIDIGLGLAPEELAAQVAKESDGGFLMLSVSDSGEGIAAEELEKIFDPFYTTKDIGQGTGMGLAVVHGIVQNHNGMIHVESAPGEGSVFKILLPLTTIDACTDEEPESRLPSGNEAVLFVDDEEDLGLWAEELLQQQGFRPVCFSDSEAALEQLRQDPQAFDLLVTDQSMPGLSGLDLVAQVRQFNPGLPVVICSGYSSRLSEDRLRALGVCSYLQKPYRSAQLLQAIRSCLDNCSQA